MCTAKIIAQFCYLTLYLGNETFFMSPVGHGLKLEKFEPFLSIFNATPTKITRTLLWLSAP